MKMYAVIGANFGDEGKGLVTNKLAEKLTNAIVVRHNGGAQAGHTVCKRFDKRTIRHVFHHIGSGYLSNADTYLSEKFILNPILLRREIDELYEETKNVRVNRINIFVNPNCRISTIYDMIANQNSKENMAHGSCGVGIFQTIKRDENIPFTFSMLLKMTTEEILKKLKTVKDYYGIDISSTASELFLQDLFFLKDNCVMKDLSFLSGYDNVIFEGAQGLMLDEEYKFFPNVTPSATGLKNPVDIANELNVTSIEVYFVTRTYFTRHGNGPLPNRDTSLIYKDDTNIYNSFQGSINFAPLDINILRDNIIGECYRNKITLKKHLVVTHMDQTAVVNFIQDEEYVNKTQNGFMKDLRSYFPDFELHFSYDARGENIF